MTRVWQPAPRASTYLRGWSVPRWHDGAMAGRWLGGVRRPGAVAAIVTVLVAAGCTAARDQAAPSSPPPPTSPTPSSSAPTTPGPSPTARGPIRIAVAGDLHFEGVLAERLRDPGTALAPVSDALSAADLTIVNLETSVGTGGAPEPGKRFTFSAGPEAFTALAAAGVDVASMANNHALDYGRARLPSTLAAIRRAARADAPLSVVGIGRDVDEAFAPAAAGGRGAAGAAAAAAGAGPAPPPPRPGQWAATDDRGGIADALDPARLLDGVRRTRETADVVVVYLHWGVQGARCPSPDQRSLAAALVDAGADIVVGSHAHRLQGDGRLGGGYVAYGLGNYAWYSPGDATTSRTGVLYLTVRPRTSSPRPPYVVRAAWAPQRIGADGLAGPTTPEDATAFRSDRESLRACSGLAR